jgi:GAF domain-containing protein
VVDDPLHLPVEDMIVQAEMLLQFASRDQAIDYINEILRIHPGEEHRNAQLMNLLVETGLAAPPPAGAVATGADGGEGLADLQRISEITRSIHRQGAVKAVLSTAVNEIGKSWQASRCVASLCMPGKPPSAGMEYCASGVQPSEIRLLVKLVTTCVNLTAGGDTLNLEDVSAEPRLAVIAPVLQALSIQSLLAFPMFENEQVIGVLLLAQCDRRRAWGPAQVVVLKSLADQVAFASTQVKLRTLAKAVADERSGLLNRGLYIDCLVAEAERALQRKGSLAVALLQFGNGALSAGDPALRQFMEEAARLLLTQLRQHDVGVRYDATTLAIIFPQAGAREALPVVERIRKVAAGVGANTPSPVPLTAAVAQAVLEEGGDAVDSVTELINRLESALALAQAQPGSTQVLAPATVSSASA